MRKSKREKEKEAAEAKRKEEEENAAKAYAEFLQTFQGEDVDRRKTGSSFVKAGQEAMYGPSAKSAGELSRAAMSMFSSGVSDSMCQAHMLVTEVSIASNTTAGGP